MEKSGNCETLISENQIPISILLIPFTRIQITQPKNVSDDEIERIEPDVRHALNEVTHLIVAENEKGEPVAFMGVTGEMLEMLFIAPKDRGKGVGKQLLLHGIKCYGIRKVTVNEQNPQAKGFYEHMGFQVYARTDHDEQGNPYPLLYMRR